MADVLFATGKYQLSQPATLALARMSGVILAHPGLSLKIAGYTDSTGSDQLNLKLSGQRADEVRTFLVQQGLNPATVTSMGMGSADPVASNDTSVGQAAEPAGGDRRLWRSHWDPERKLTLRVKRKSPLTFNQTFARP